MISLLRQKSFRDTASQVGFIGVLILLVVTFALTAKTNLDAQGMTSGFGFLERATGWGVSFSLIPFDTNDTYARVILVGLLNSLFLGAISLTLATVIGIGIGIMRVSGNKMAELIGTVYVEIFRNLPLLLQAFFWYAVLTTLPRPRDALEFGGVAFLNGRGAYLPGLNVTGFSVFLAAIALAVTVGLWLWLRSARRFARMAPHIKKAWSRGLWLGWAALAVALLWAGRIPETPLLSIPTLKGLNFRGGIRVSPELLTCIIAISVYGGAYIGEIVRAGFNAVGKGQSEAGHALGLSTWQTFTRIRLPLAIRAVMPMLINQYVWLFKSTTIGIAVGFVDFFMVISTSINQSGQTLELIAILMGGFLVINYSMAWVLNRVNDAIKLKGTQLRT
ncbi:MULTISPECIES: amino acid ABC transporter permease [Marinovum]|uniref:General L-amino acid transport system permease protein n=1 Tax=Marinovum algicola TaxID=42444 RepID=A0A975ZPL3_9RHOB|nr:MULTISPECIES: ABC transporter permease subunit [Marinovum]MDD9739370.1 ABC transporter permease subunit [Marinovum sp. SP66]SEJ90476.1 general L-amino acid transport system permease protein [Marinovum algicola]SLN43188.1 Glutamate/aspartate transport system permease protein GltK [Marinovum algicola]